jgi:hypothetical protein
MINITMYEPQLETITEENNSQVNSDVDDENESEKIDNSIKDSQCSHCRNNSCFSFNISEEDVTDSSSDVTVVLKDISEGEQIDTENDSEDYIEDYNEDRIKSYRYIDEVITEEDIIRFSNLNINDDI